MENRQTNKLKTFIYNHKNMKTKQLLIFIIFLINTIQAWAFTVDGINYSITSSKNNLVEVTGYDKKAALKTINIPNTVNFNGKVYSVTGISGSAFSGSSDIVSVTLPNSIEVINYFAFRNCKNLTSITLSSNLTTIGHEAFQSCESLSSISLPNSLTTIDYGAFRGCTMLASIHIPAGVENISLGTFTNCINLASVTLPNGLLTIGDGAFSGCEKLVSIDIPHGVTTLGKNAFINCTMLESVSIPASITSFREGAFNNCANLKNFKVGWMTPASLRYAFWFTGVSLDLVTLIVPKEAKLLYWEEKIWQDFGLILEEGETIHQVSDFVIRNDGALVQYKGSSTDVVIPGSIGISKIDLNAFRQNTKITSVSLPTGVVSIDEYAFYECTKLNSIVLNSDLKSIENAAFAYCSSLQSVNLPEGITSIGDGAFAYCRNLKSINLPNSITSIGTIAFGECLVLESITLPNKITRIEEGTFFRCEKIEEVIIPVGVTFIGKGAFFRSQHLYTVEIPYTVTTIGEQAFGRTYLYDLRVNWSRPLNISGLDLFYDLSRSQINLTVPANTGNLYKADPEWGIMKIKESSTEGGSAISIAGISLNKTTLTLETGNSETLVVTVAPTNATNKTVAWKSSNENVVTVTNGGVVTAISAGTVNITATTEDGGKTATCVVTVTGGNTQKPEFEVVNGVLVKYNGVGGDVTIPNDLGITTIGYQAFIDCKTLTSIVIPSRITAIEKSAFSNCTNLVSVQFPNTLLSIGERAFLSCTTIKAIDIPVSVQTIIEGAFFNCTELRDVSVHWSTPLALTNHIFNDVTYNSATLHVPTGKKEAYMAESADVWNEFKNISDGTATLPYSTSEIEALKEFISQSTNYAKLGLDEGWDANEQWIEKMESVVWVDYDTEYRIKRINFTGLGLEGNLDASAFSFLEILNVGNNSLININVSGLYFLREFDCSNNRLFFLHVSDNYFILNFKCNDNFLTFTTLPERANYTTYTYSPQNYVVFTTTPEGNIDLSEYLHNGKTSFSWYADNSTTRLNDITEISTGVFNIPAKYSGMRLACQMTNSDFPAFSSSNSLLCKVDVSSELQVKIEQSPTAETDNSGSVAIKVRIPSGAERMKGSLTVKLDEKLSSENDNRPWQLRLSDEFQLILFREGNDWIYKTINVDLDLTKYARANRTTRSEPEEITLFSLNFPISKTTPNGEYEIEISDLRFDFDDGTSYRIDRQTTNITVNRNGTGIEHIHDAKDIIVYIADGKLTVNSPSAEQIGVYSITGELLYHANKPEGEAIFNINSIPRGVVIIKGHSGWTRKVIK